MRCRAGSIRDEDACLKMSTGGRDCTDYGFSNCRGQHILGPDLNHARPTQFSCGQEHPEIKVVREDNVAMLRGVAKNLGVRCGNVANRRPVNRLVSVTRQEGSPQRT
jgi:hypothetical protein